MDRTATPGRVSTGKPLGGSRWGRVLGGRTAKFDRARRSRVGTRRPSWSVGAIVLGLVIGGLALARWKGAEQSLDAPVCPLASDFVSPEDAVAFGWPISCDEASARVWDQVPGIGTVLAGRLAASAEERLIDSSSSLLRVRGIGPKIALRLDSWVMWSYEDGGCRCCRLRPE